MPGNTELKQEAPYDARLVVEKYSDLVNPETWKDENGRVWLYDGMAVSVLESSSRGLYILTDKTKYTSRSSWRFVVEVDGEGISHNTTGKICLRIDQPYNEYNFLSIGSGGLKLNVGTDSRGSLVYGDKTGLTFDVGQGLKISTNDNGEHYVELDANHLLLATNNSPIYVDSWGFVQMNLGAGLYVDKTRLSLGTAGMLCLDTNIRESSGGSLLLTTLTSPIYADESNHLRLSVGTGLSIKPSVDIYPAAIQLDVDDLNRRLSELELTTRTSSVYKDGNGFLRLRLSSGLEELMPDPYGNTFLKIKLAKEDAALRFDENDGLGVDVNEVQKSLVLATGLARDDANALYAKIGTGLKSETDKSISIDPAILSKIDAFTNYITDNRYGVGVLLKNGRYVDYNHMFDGQAFDSGEVEAFTYDKNGHSWLIFPIPTQREFCRNTNVPTLPKIQGASMAAYNEGYAFKGKEYCEAIREYVTNPVYAVNWAYSQELGGNKCWIPSLGELKALYDEKDIINNLVTRCGLTQKFFMSETFSSSLANRQREDGTQVAEEYSEEGTITCMFGTQGNGNFDGFPTAGNFMCVAITDWAK